MVIDAIIFDLDGVICYTDEYHYKAWKQLADKLGVHFDRGINNRLRGVSRMESLEIILESYEGQPLSDEEKNQLAEDKNSIYRNYLQSMNTNDLSDEVRETLETLKSQGYLLAIGSSSKNAPLILEKIGLSDYFFAVSDGNNIEKSKPDPEVFLKAAHMMQKEPESCLVVEDAVAGAQAGKAGGFTVACVGDAARIEAGDYNLSDFRSLIDLLANIT